MDPICPDCGQRLGRLVEQKSITRFQVLLMGDCNTPGCVKQGSTITYGRRDMTDAERRDAAELIKLLKGE